MKITAKVVDVHSKMGTRESAAAKGRSVNVAVHEIIMVGESVGSTPTTVFQIGVQTEDPNVARDLQLGSSVEFEIPVGNIGMQVVK